MDLKPVRLQKTKLKRDLPNKCVLFSWLNFKFQSNWSS